MAHKITLGTRPKNFKHVVEVPLHEGTTGRIEVLYRYRTRDEFGKFIDQVLADAQVPRPTDEDALGAAMQQAMSDMNGRNAQYLLQVLDGWDLDVDLNLAHVQQLCNEMPAAAARLMEDYRLACVEGRLGN